MLEMMIGSRNTTPPKMLRIVPFGEVHILLRLNSLTRTSSGVMVAHFTPTPCFLIAMSDAEVVVLQIYIEIGMDQPVLDELPNDACHLVAVEFDDSALDLDLRHGANLSNGHAAV